MPHFPPPGVPERRDPASRDALLRRVRAEFEEMPGLRLTSTQMQRLFSLRADVCERILATLQRDGTLMCDRDVRYELTASMCGR